MINAKELAKFILSTYSDVPIYPMKLQKLAYYAKVWSVVADYNFIEADFEKWEYGPVNRDIYYEYIKYSKTVIPVPKGEVRIDIAQEEFLKFVLQNYIEQSAVSLSIQTHKEQPWKETPPNEIISDDVIKRYYSKLNYAKNFQRDNYKAAPFYVLKTNNWHSLTMDMDMDEASFYETYPSYDEYLERTRKAKSVFDGVLGDISTQ